MNMLVVCFVFFFKQKTAYEMRISDWSSDVCSSDLLVEPGSRPRTIAQTMNKAGIHVNEDAFVILARLTGQDKQLQAGAYEAVQGDSPRVLLERMASGDMTQTDRKSAV